MTDLAEQQPGDRIDAAARAILARRAEEPTTSWEVVPTIAEPGDEQAIDARLAEYAKQIRAGVKP